MRRSFIVVVAAFSLAVVSGACSSGGGGNGTTTSPGATDSSSSCTSSSAQQLSSGTETIQGFAFDPTCFSVTTGSQIKLTNKDSVPHTFTVTGTEVNVQLDGTQSSTADLSSLEPGTYEFHCVIHPSMTGTLIVS